VLAKHFRIKQSDFFRNKSPVKKKFSDRFSLLIKKKDDKKNGFVINVPVKLDKRSVYRNRTRRMIELIIRELPFDSGKNAMILIRARKILNKNELAKAAGDLKKLLQNEFY